MSTGSQLVVALLAVATMGLAKRMIRRQVGRAETSTPAASLARKGAYLAAFHAGLLVVLLCGLLLALHFYGEDVAGARPDGMLVFWIAFFTYWLFGTLSEVAEGWGVLWRQWRQLRRPRP